MEKTICELFAGVGGFRLGFERLKSGWETKWFSQWEPSQKKQWAYECYVAHFGNSKDINGQIHTNEDISNINKNLIPNHNLLLAGFPCQDYSVAHTLSSSKGIQGKKGVLWWQIRDTLIAKHPSFCIFENVDRLLKSPAKQRGRDFGIILSCLAELDYSVEWRVINAAKYGAAQQRKRVFIFAYKNNLKYGKDIIKEKVEDIIAKKGLMAKSFPIESIGKISTIDISKDIYNVSKTFSFHFENSGYMNKYKCFTTRVIEKEEKSINLSEIINPIVDKDFYIEDKEQILKWEYLKKAKKIQRESKNGYKYIYSEGQMAFPDYLDKPARTILTSEATINRCSHIILDIKQGKLRTLTPLETERLNGFDDNWTNIGMPKRMRYFCMGNALVVPMITRMGKVLDSIIEKE